MKSKKVKRYYVAEDLSHYKMPPIVEIEGYYKGSSGILGERFVTENDVLRLLLDLEDDSFPIEIYVKHVYETPEKAYQALVEQLQSEVAETLKDHARAIKEQMLVETLTQNGKDLNKLFKPLYEYKEVKVENSESK